MEEQLTPESCFSFLLYYKLKRKRVEYPYIFFQLKKAKKFG